MTEQKTILCYGHSLTWGWIPEVEGAPTLRYAYRDRWTGAMAAQLGDGYHIIEEGLSARTTSLDDPNDSRLNDSAYLPSALASHLPLDLGIVMLGTNDTKSYFGRTSYEIATGMAKLVGQISGSAGASAHPIPRPRCWLWRRRPWPRCRIRFSMACLKAGMQRPPPWPGNAARWPIS